MLFILLTVQANAAPLVQLRLDELLRHLGPDVVEIAVIEPHAKCYQDNHPVTFVGIPLRKVLGHYYADAWKGSDREIHFVARDGYLAVIKADDARENEGYLTFARADGKPFVVDNDLQNERNVPLGPFYLVWDNLKNGALQKKKSYAWPYQVVGIRLESASIYQNLLPADASASVRDGFEAYKKYCLSCHQINGTGGTKNEADMKQLVHGKSRNDLRAWISDPQKVRCSTTMPAIDTGLDKVEQDRIVDRIIDFLEAL